MKSNILLWNKEVGFIRVNEGDGCNLLPEDEKEGYEDYIMIDFMNYNGYELSENDEVDNPQVMLTELYQEKFKTVEDVIKYLIDCEWIPDAKYMVLYAK